MFLFHLLQIDDHPLWGQLGKLKVTTEFESGKAFIGSHFVSETRETVNSLNRAYYAFFDVADSVIIGLLLLISHLLQCVCLEVVEKGNKPLRVFGLR